jgi:hypothetical protein
MLPRKVKDLARETRLWAEQIARNEEFPNDLCGLCLRASARLFTQLSTKGYTPQICLSEDSTTGYHVFIKLNDMIIDVTATQFRYHSPILIRHQRELRNFPYKKYVAFTSLESLKSHEVPWEERERIQNGDLLEKT